MIYLLGLLLLLYWGYQVVMFTLLMIFLSPENRRALLKHLREVK